MKRFTLIKKGNDITQFNYVSEVKYLNEVDVIVIDDQGNISVNKGNPITWPTDATNGLQAIVDVKAGTLRFGILGALPPHEFVVSEYVAPAPHIFDLVDNWPQQHRGCLGTMPLPEGWEWKWFGDDWVLGNGVIGLVRDDWFKHKFGDAEPAKQFEPFVSAEDSDPATVKQSAPKGKGNPILGMVLADLTNRALEGKEKYGEPLLANNGRNALWDAYQEALDLAMYLRQAIEEQE